MIPPQTTGGDCASPALVRRILDRYVLMARIRAFEEAAIQAHHDGLIKGSLHPYIGEEAIASGICGGLRRTDLVASNHRGHGHAIAKGAKLEAMMCELFGRIGGTSNGKGGSMHIADFSVGMLGANGIVGAGIPIAVGAAQGKRLLGEAVVVVCFFGDGAINRGQFFEGLNWARIFDLPVLFVCEDNEYASTTRTRALTGGPGPAARAESFGIPAYSFDGNDVVAIDALASDVIERIRRGGGPAFFHARTYRFRGHTVFDRELYRTRAEVREREQFDPIPRCRRFLTERGISDSELAAIEANAQSEVASAVSYAHSAPMPEPEFAKADVQDIGAPR